MLRRQINKNQLGIRTSSGPALNCFRPNYSNYPTIAMFSPVDRACASPTKIRNCLRRFRQNWNRTASHERIESNARSITGVPVGREPSILCGGDTCENQRKSFAGDRPIALGSRHTIWHAFPRIGGAVNYVRCSIMFVPYEIFCRGKYDLNWFHCCCQIGHAWIFSYSQYEKCRLVFG